MLQAPHGGEKCIEASATHSSNMCNLSRHPPNTPPRDPRLANPTRRRVGNPSLAPAAPLLYRAATRTNLSDSKRYKLVCIPVVADKTRTAGRPCSCPASDAGFLPSITLGCLLSFEQKATSGYWSLSINKGMPCRFRAGGDYSSSVSLLPLVELANSCHCGDWGFKRYIRV